MNTSLNQQSKPWYTYPFVWMLIAIPLSAVIVGGLFLYLSISTFDGLVVDDYYKKGKEINLVLKRDIQAKSLQLSAKIDFSNPSQTLVYLDQSQTASPSKPEQLRLSLLHPTRSGFDQTLTMNLMSNGSYLGAAGSYPDGKWLIQLSTDEWRLMGETTFPIKTPISLRPQ